jgi:putative ABC transport system permease protein
MFKSYLKASLRFFANNRGFSLLNIAGLSVGTICCIYILIYVRDQYGYDRYFSDAAHIYRVTSSVQAGNNAFQPEATTPTPLSPALGANFRDLLVSTRIIPTIGAEEHLLWSMGKQISVKDGYRVDTNFFQVFDFHFVEGSPEDVFSRPFGVVLLQSVASALFGNVDPMGKEVIVNDSYGIHRFIVTGVVDESRGKSSIHANIFFAMTLNSFGNDFLQDYNWMDHYSAYTFVKLKPGVSARDLEERLPALLSQHLGWQAVNKIKTALHLQPVGEIHTTDGYDSEMGRTVSGFFLAILIGVAALIQLIACINYMNLSTARASKRAKEVGVRKIIGADNKGLVLQFLMESVTLSLAAVLIALPLLVMVLPWINQATGAEIPRTIFAEPTIWCLLFALGTVTGLLAGSYPAYYLSAFRAPRVIKGDFTSHISVGGLRRLLVVFQFILTIVLIVGMIIIRQQLDFVKNKDLGFNKGEQIAFKFHTAGAQKNANYFAIAMREFPDVTDACPADNYPGALSYRNDHLYLQGAPPGTAINVQTMSSDEHFLKTMGIPLIGGSNFHFADTGSVIVNQSMVRALGLDFAKAPGASILNWDGTRYTIVGVMKNFNYQSLHDTVSPFMVVYKLGFAQFDHLIVSAKGPRFSLLLARMAVIWKRRVFVDPVGFQYRFLTDEVELLYMPEIIMSRIISSFTIVALFISCLGLFGLVAFNAEQRTKEIGIRKVMGASVGRIVQLLSMDFLQLISLSFALGTPIAWWIMSRWLNVFAYHIQMPWWTFGIAGGAAIIIGMTVVSYQAFKAAVINPVKSLRAV